MRKLIALTLTLALLAGCNAGTPSATPAPTEQIETSPASSPQPTFAPNSTAQYSWQPTTETVQQFTAVLYFPHSGGARLVSETRDITISPGVTYAQAVVQALMGAPTRLDLVRAVPEGTYVLDIEWTGELVTVNLSHHVLNLNEYDRLLLRQSFINTLTDLAGINYVSILVENRAFGCYYLPMGPQSRATGNVSSLQYAREGEVASMHSGVADADNILTRDVVLYFIDSRGQMLVPEVRRVDFMGTDYLSQLIEQLMRGPTDTKTMERCAPATRFLTADTLMFNDRLTLRLTFSGEMTAFTARKGLEPKLAYGAVLMTILSFYPDIDDIEISVSGEQIVSLPDIEMPDRPFTRGHFSHMVARPITLYFPTRDELSLVPVTRAIRYDEAAQPHKLLDELKAGPTALEDPLAASPFTEGIAGTLGVTIQENRAYVKMSADMVESCANLTPLQERNLVYSIVNTLCEMPGIKLVYFTKDGAALTTLAGHIDLSGPLLKNPGLARR